jgi:hypothetical protein
MARKKSLESTVQKHRPRPKRNIKNPDDDHPVGLWIDKDLLRRHQNSQPQTIIHGVHESDGNRYLQLADIALGTAKGKKKTKAAGS